MIEEVVYEDEIWKPIDGYDGVYEVSNYGRVKSYYRKGSHGNVNEVGYLMKIKSDKVGYQLVGLTKDSKQKVLKVHRLVAQAFLDNFHELDKIGHQVDHIDGVRHNNTASNLQMLSHFDNCFKRTGRNAFQKLKATNIHTGEILFFNGQNEASRALGVNQGNIYNNLAGKTKQVGGFKFERVKENDSNE